MSQTGITVRNAGIVLVNTYVPMLFERLELTHDKKFVSETAQIRATHYLQYLVTGLSATEESLLSLNKIMCGLSLTHAVPEAITISEEQKKLLDGLLKAMISNWPSIGDSSIQGFRENWLVRNGSLSETGEKWELTVEKKAYDLLIHKSPFSFSIIKFPWMEKPLHVNWNY
jgi:hypothetical protein